MNTLELVPFLFAEVKQKAHCITKALESVNELMQESRSRGTQSNFKGAIVSRVLPLAASL